MSFAYKIEKKLPGHLGRAGVITTPHGEIKTPAFVVVGTKATVKALTPEQVKELGAQVVLANTYHLYLEPGDKLVKKAGGLHKMMDWNGPIVTDSGGFQVFSLGAAYEEGGINKFLTGHESAVSEESAVRGPKSGKLAAIDEEGVTFKSYLDGSTHRFTPERSMEIQYNLGADIIFAFDECTAPTASYEYQQEALGRTHAWAKRSLERHEVLDVKQKQALFGVVQGGRFQDLRELSARFLAELRLRDGAEFDGFGIGGSFEKKDIGTAVAWVNAILPENKPRHLLGIGEPEDFFAGVENGIDTFDCVIPTRLGRTGTLMTAMGKINILNAQYREDFSPIETGCACYTCEHYSRAYLAHLFRAKEMLGATLASIHNLYFCVHLVAAIQESILDDTFSQFRDEFLKHYQ